MKRKRFKRLALGALSATLLTASLALHAEEKPQFLVRWGNFPDGSPVESGQLCAPYISSLIGPRGGYEIFAATSVGGPPGVIYTLKTKNGKSVAILKCSDKGGEGEDETGGGCGG